MSHEDCLTIQGGGDTADQVGYAVGYAVGLLFGTVLVAAHIVADAIVEH